MKVVAFRVQFKRVAVSYPGVGRFRRAETGILGRAIKGVPLGLPFLFGAGRVANSRVKEAGGTPALRDGLLAEIYPRRSATILAFCDI
jgi:hypothetical protein